MSELKITIDQLKNYLGTGLKFHAMGCHVDEYSEPKIPAEFELIGISPDWVEGDSLYLQKDFMIVDIFPHCYRLSDLDKLIPELGFVPIEKLSEWTTTELNSDLEIEQAAYDGCMVSLNTPYELDWFTISKLFQWHFWPFGDQYFEAGLVIDKLSHNTPTN